ncbi:MAG: ATP-binding protein [Bacteroidales bacterium]|nr:ATP-binding protein [Bacteroidales bacterium]
MKEITVLSGKGGTGKTSITAALATIVKNAVFCDNDVDAANLHLVFGPVEKERHVFEGAWLATINTELCTQCGICADYCRFDAIKEDEHRGYYIDAYKCEGCRLCERVCPEGAVSSERSKNNHWFVSGSRMGTLVHAEMGPGEENSGKLVSVLRGKARSIAREEHAVWIINDGPPGIGCAAISSLTGTDAAIIVTEPSRSGLHDLKRIVELIGSFGIPAYAMINKYDLQPELTKEIRAFLASKGISTIALIPFSETFVHAMVKGVSVIEHDPESEISVILFDAWEKFRNNLA